MHFSHSWRAYRTLHDVSLLVNRERVYQSTFDELGGANGDGLPELGDPAWMDLGTIHVSFEGEDGMGVGVMREWLTAACVQAMRPDHALWVELSSDPTLFSPSADSGINQGHLDHFTFCGHLLGLALRARVAVGVCLAPHVLRFLSRRLQCREGAHLLHDAAGPSGPGQAERPEAERCHVVPPLLPTAWSACLEELQAVDSAAAASLRTLPSCSTSDLAALDLRFTVTVGSLVGGRPRDVELLPGGERLEVHACNVLEYVRLRCGYALFGCVSSQLGALCKGLAASCNWPWLLDEAAVTELLRGPDTVDVPDWKAHTDVATEWPAGARCIRWFWEFVEGLAFAARSKLLQFMSGMRRGPPDGFGSLARRFRLSFGQAWPSADAERRYERDSHVHEVHLAMLPRSHACFYELVLPQFRTARQLRRHVGYAIEHLSQGFSDE